MNKIKKFKRNRLSYKNKKCNKNSQNKRNKIN